MSRNIKIAVALYAVFAVVTFGRAAADPRRVCFDTVKGEVSSFCPSETLAAPAMFAGVAWPLYWSWEAWS